MLFVTMRPSLAHLLFHGFFLALCHVAYSANGTSDNSICKRVSGTGDLSKKHIFCVGKMSKYFLVVTSDWFIYELPPTSLNSTINQLYFGNVTPKAMKDRWPNLWNSPCWDRVKSKIYDGYTVRDRNSEYFLVTIKNDTRGGCTYDLHSNKVLKGVNFFDQGARPDMRMISADTVANYYGISTNKDDVLGIDKYEFCYKCSKGVYWNGFYYCKGGTLLQTTWISPGCTTPTYYPMCRQGSEKMSIEKDNQTACSNTGVNWNIYAGFVNEGTFYFFGPNYVFVFSEKAWTTKGVPVSLRAVKFGDFINCDGVAQARDLGVSKKSPVRFGLLVAIILIIVLLLLCCLLCLMREAMERRKKKKKGGKDDDSKSSSWLPTSLGGASHKAGDSGKPGSARSVGLPGFGFLTGKKPSTNKPSKSKSKRSTGLPRGGSLSKKGVPGTKRSKGGPSRGGSLSKKGGPLTKRSGGAGEPDGSISRKGIPGTKRSAPAGPGGSISRKGVPATKRSRALNGGRTVTGPDSRDPGASNRSGQSKRKGGNSGARSGNNNATGRSRGMRTAAGGSRGKRSISRGASNKATERSNLRKR